MVLIFGRVHVFSQSGSYNAYNLVCFTFTINIFCITQNACIIFTEEYTIISFTDFLIQGISLFHLLLLLKIKRYKETFEHRFVLIFQIISLELKIIEQSKSINHLIIIVLIKNVTLIYLLTVLSDIPLDNMRTFKSNSHSLVGKYSKKKFSPQQYVQ